MIESRLPTPANRLFGLNLRTPAKGNSPVWHEYVAGLGGAAMAAGRHRGLFFGDYFMRASKAQRCLG